MKLRVLPLSLFGTGHPKRARSCSLNSSSQFLVPVSLELQAVLQETVGQLA